MSENEFTAGIWVEFWDLFQVSKAKDHHSLLWVILKPSIPADLLILSLACEPSSLPANDLLMCANVLSGPCHKLRERSIPQ